MRKSGVYAITCVPTGEKYIGSTMDLRARWGNHKAHLKKGNHSSRRLQEAYDKHGPDQFTCELVEAMTSEALVSALIALGEQMITTEQKWLDAEKPAFNVAIHAGIATQKGRKSWWHDGGKRVEEARKKIAASRRAARKTPLKGPPKRSAEVRAKISAGMMGKNKKKA